MLNEHTNLRVEVTQHGDGFSIAIINSKDEKDMYRTTINQEDTVEDLADVFQLLGFKSTFISD